MGTPNSRSMGRLGMRNREKRTKPGSGAERLDEGLGKIADLKNALGNRMVGRIGKPTHERAPHDNTVGRIAKRPGMLWLADPEADTYG